MVNPAWMPPPEEYPPIPDRAKNLVRHFALILAVIAVLGAPLVLTLMARSRAPRARDELQRFGALFALYETRFQAWPQDPAELEAGLSAREAVHVPRKCGACGAEYDGWWNYQEFAPAPGTSYAWRNRLTASAPADLPIAWCPACGEVLFFSGQVGTSDARKGPVSISRAMGLVRK